MKEELKSMDHNEVWDLVELPERCKELGVSGSLRPSVTLRAMLKDTRLDTLLNVSLRYMVLIIKRPFLQFLKRIHLEYHGIGSSI